MSDFEGHILVHLSCTFANTFSLATLTAITTLPAGSWAAAHPAPVLRDAQQMFVCTAAASVDGLFVGKRPFAQVNHPDE